MKLKIKNSTLTVLSPVYMTIYIIFLLLALFLLHWLAVRFQAITFVWKDLLSYAQKDNLVSYIFICIFPAIVALWAVLFFWSRASAWNKARKTNPIISLSFEETAVRLERKKPRTAIILPYTETDFSVGLPVFVSYNKYGHAFPHLAELEITFSHAGKTYSIRHKGKLPAVQTLLDESKKFRSFSADIKRLSAAKPATSVELDFIRFLKEQLENHRRYGLLLPQYPVPRAIFTILGVIGVGALDLGLGMQAMFLFTTSAWLLFPVVLLLMVTGLTFWCAVDIKNYFAFRAVAAKLEKLKQNLPY